jgi:hypothetical protein
MLHAQSWGHRHDRMRIAITLEYALDVAQESFETFPFPAHPKVEHHRSARPAVLPEVGSFFWHGLFHLGECCSVLRRMEPAGVRGQG